MVEQAVGDGDVRLHRPHVHLVIGHGGPQSTLRVDAQVGELAGERLEAPHPIVRQPARHADAELTVATTDGPHVRLGDLDIHGDAQTPARVDEDVGDERDVLVELLGHALGVVVERLERLAVELEHDPLAIPDVDAARLGPRHVELEAVEVPPTELHELVELLGQRVLVVGGVVDEVDRAPMWREEPRDVADVRVAVRPLVRLAAQRLAADEHPHHESPRAPVRKTVQRLDGGGDFFLLHETRHPDVRWQHGRSFEDDGIPSLCLLKDIRY